jgi:hypothetical protein
MDACQYVALAHRLDVEEAVDWWLSLRRSVSQIWLQVRKDIRKKLGFLRIVLVTSWNLLSKYGDFVGNFSKKIFWRIPTAILKSKFAECRNFAPENNNNNSNNNK